MSAAESAFSQGAMERNRTAGGGSGGAGSSGAAAAASSAAAARLPSPSPPVGGRSAAGQPASAGFTRAEPRPTVLAGRFPVSCDRRKYRYDPVQASRGPLQVTVTRDDRMSATEAGEALHAIHVMLGVHTESPELLYQLDQSLWICHALNGASVLNPGRSTFGVPGQTLMFNFGVIRDRLGVDLRRFFRAFADDVVGALQSALAAYDTSSPESMELWGWIQEVAANRNLQRFPHLCADSADACTFLTHAERVALSASKAAVLSTSANAADRMEANARTLSAERYDSTTRTVV